ncbi:hypothetical protein ARMSODRAFT_897688 [Armillaria solidipes]|uniref:Uncharacterized protein n=1 Tax=Armillaria solidipes TaxID=1076256 RepID=A0A2H3AP72_9AGAR|nr:hypothetical protein ARMSODRAFT_897688 [Armillaria solidipes]
MFKFASIAMIALTAMFLSAGQVNGAALIADNAVDACNGSNNYGVGHSCAFKQSQGGKCSSLTSIYCTAITLLIVLLVCKKNACGNLICRPN